MEWWEVFDLWEFILHPMKYGVPPVDTWIKEWGNWINLFVQTNPWFFGFLTGTGFSWFTWFVMHTPWKWDDKWPDWVSKHILKKPSLVVEGETNEKEKREVLRRLNNEIQKQEKPEEVKP